LPTIGCAYIESTASQRLRVARGSINSLIMNNSDFRQDRGGLAREACSTIDERIREERFAERARIVEYLAYVLPDTDETREAIADVFNGAHHRP
jgi:hypothetical protein